MIRYLKKGLVEEQHAASDNASVREVVQSILSGISEHGDSKVRELSEKFDNWSPNNFRLSESEIQACIAELPQQDIEDIKFAQAQVRRFAEAQRGSMKDVEIETLPGIILGHKHIPVSSVGCYVPGGKYPLVASAHMGVVTAKVASGADNRLRASV